MIDPVFPDSKAQEHAQLKTDLLIRKRRELKRLRRLLFHLEEDLTRTHAALEREADAQLLKYNLHRIKRGSAEIDVINYLDPLMPIKTIKIDQTLTPKENLERLFHAIHKAKRGLDHILPRLGQTRAEITELETEIVEIENAESIDFLEQKETFERSKSSKPTPKSSPVKANHHTFFSTDGRRILVGKSAKKNEELAFRIAKGNDWWFHVRDFPGSHVIVVNEGKQLLSEVLIDAATLAAHFSKAKNESLVDICYTQAKNLKRSRRAPGSVLVTKEKVITIKLEEPRLHRLLQTKQSSPTSK